MKKLVFLALIYCSLFTVHSSLSYSAALLDRVVATVNHDAITWSELRKNIELENKEFLKDLNSEEKEKKIKELEKPFLKIMIDIKLQLQEANKFGLNVSPSEINNAIDDIKKKYSLTDEAFIESLRTEGFTIEEYKSRLREQILLSKSLRHNVKDMVLITDEEIKEYYKANKEKFDHGEKISIRQILFILKDSSQKTEIEARAKEILKQIEKGEDFAKLASNFSEDASKKFAGDLGYISRGNVLKEIEDVAFALNIGEVSKPFWSSKGLHIIKLEDRLESALTKKDREEIKEILFEKAFKSKHEEWIKKLREDAFIEINL